MVKGARAMNEGTAERCLKKSTYRIQINVQKNYSSYRHYINLNKLFNWVGKGMRVTVPS